MRTADFCESRLVHAAMRGCDLRETDFTKVTVPGLRLAGVHQLDGVRGALHLRGVVIEGDRAIPLALSLFSELGIELRNEDDA
ncbi:MAG: pentapeptide repeat-containing protein [Acidimicrobiia bacterium]